jgi:hypothetical protein
MELEDIPPARVILFSVGNLFVTQVSTASRPTACETVQECRKPRSLEILLGDGHQDRPRS